MSSRSRRVWWGSIAVGILGLIWSGMALADQYDALLTRAVAAKERAREANDPASWLEASRLFQQADALRPTPETKYELAYAAEHLRQDDVAVELYQVCLEQGISGRAREHARRFVELHLASLGRLDVRGEAGTTVSLGGVARGKLPLARPLVVFAGKTTLELTGPNGSQRTQTVEVRAGEIAVVELGAVPQSGAAPPPSVPPSAAPVVQPIPRLPLPPPVAVAPPSSSNGLGIGLLITGSVITVASGVMLLVASTNLASAREHLARTCDEPGPVTDSCVSTAAGKQAQAQSDVNSIASWKSLRLGTYIGLAVGLASVGVGGVVLGTSSRRAKAGASGPVRAGLALGPGGGSLELGARF